MILWNHYFQQVSLNTELGIIHWPNQADIWSEVLYAELSGKSIENQLSLNDVS